MTAYQFDASILNRRFEHDAGAFPFQDWVEALESGEFNTRTLLTQRFAIVRSRSNAWQLLAPRSPPGFPNAFHYGHVDVKTSLVEDPQEPKVLEPQIYEELRRDFVTFLDRLEEDGVNVILVEPPIYAKGWTTINGHDELIRKIAEERGLRYLDFNEEFASSINDDPALFRDHGHLNGRGASEFSARLAPIVRSLLDREPAESLRR